MQDSDTLPVDHAGNSEGPAGPKIPPWLIGAVAPPILMTGGAYFSAPADRTKVLIGLGVGVGISVAYVGWLAFRDYRRLSVARQMQDMIEDAWTAFAKGEVPRAEELLKETVKLSGQKLGRFDLVTLACLHTLGNLYRLQKDHAGANHCYEQAQPIYDKILPRNHPARAAFHGHRARVLLALGQQPQALLEAHTSVELFRCCPGQEINLAEAHSLVGNLAAECSENDMALEAYSEALEILRKRLAHNDPKIMTAMSQLCRMYIKLRRFQESEQFLLDLLQYHRDQPDSEPEEYLEGLLDLASLRVEQQAFQEAEPLLIEALTLLQTKVGPKDRPLQRVLDAYKRMSKDSVVDAQTTHGLVNLLLIFCGEREKLRQTLEKFPLWMNARDGSGWGPLHWAAFIGREDILRWLLQKGAEISKPGDKVSPLHVAAAWSKRECLLELLEAGSDLNARDPQGWTALFWCAFSGRTKLLELLIKRGADVNLRDDLGRTPLHIAAEQGHLSAVAALVGSGANLTAKDFTLGQSPLHRAADRGHLAVAECLVFNQGDLGAKDERGKSPLDLAYEKRHRLLTRVLRRLTKAGLGRGRMRAPGRSMSLDIR